MNEDELKLLVEIVKILNKAKFNLKTPEMVQTSRILEMFGQLIKKYQDKNKEKLIVKETKEAITKK